MLCPLCTIFTEYFFTDRVIYIPGSRKVKTKQIFLVIFYMTYFKPEASSRNHSDVTDITANQIKTSNLHIICIICTKISLRTCYYLSHLCVYAPHKGFATQNEKRNGNKWGKMSLLLICLNLKAIHVAITL